MKKRILSLLCSLALLAAMLPVSAFAADASWAAEAVKTLNGIYGSGVFSADEGAMTRRDAKAIAKSAGWSTYKINSDSDVKLTRADACEVLADVFDLPVMSDQTAIEYLYGQNIVNGKGPNNFAENDPVTAAEFSVLTYRVLNAVGGGKGSDTGLKPGTDEYFAWMYLAARKCVTLEVYANAADTAIKDVTMKTVLPDGSDAGEKAGKDLWDAWVARLNSLTKKPPSLNYNGDAKLLDAVKMIVAAYAPETIFSDVPAGSPYYDGVMYLFDRAIITGNGDGSFAPDQMLPRQQLAALLYRYGASNPVSGEEQLSAAMTYVQEKGYLQPDNGNDTAWWEATATREETITAIVKVCADETDVSKANTAVLGRFSDNDKVSEDAKQSIAYAVSIGILRGNQDGTLGLSDGASRGQAGVLLYRTLIGLDETKMKDYADNVSASLQNSAAPALLSLPVQRAETTVVKTLTLREDWRLTSDLDLNVPEGTALTIDGAGHHIYEMGGRLLNSGAGTVTFAEGTILYPAGGATEGVTVNGTWDTEESNVLMTARQSGSSGGGSSSGGGGGGSSSSSSKPSASVSGAGGKVDVADDGTVTITPDEGYRIDSITINGEEIQIPTDGKLTGLDKDDEVVVTFAKDTISVIGPFADVSVDAWYADAVQYVYEKGMMNGTSENSFSPDETTTRGMIVTMLHRLENEPAASASAFNDVAAGSWYADAVAWAAAQGVVNGISDTAFAPDTAITREQMAAILYRYAQSKGQGFTGAWAFQLDYPDADAVSDYAYEAMCWATLHGIINGMGDGSLAPQGAATRAQVATMLMRFIENIA